MIALFGVALAPSLELAPPDSSGRARHFLPAASQSSSRVPGLSVARPSGRLLPGEAVHELW